MSFDTSKYSDLLAVQPYYVQKNSAEIQPRLIMKITTPVGAFMNTQSERISKATAYTDCVNVYRTRNISPSRNIRRFSALPFAYDMKT